ncbi:MAG: L-histidine N(alpha)-methyltransferase, partial [Hymenobacteraceae bacterium]|nr:L-histidine N(alpha)-methyltransferase [Hymenobacteraceae bacterium]MDX5396743.1 L-histidine N(alpha)-methyltransferase [Hymenobacteraceae bacterium]MDX5442610.1 L-histidine N(alpha)-methyltransferase [Hymenobacteraceae bacterium]MDX5512805.1 L-histidine N(alpha)-methyltransferase [Hymenobacteraceae bacterium]
MIVTQTQNTTVHLQQTDNKPDATNFAKDVDAGLSQSPKTLSSMYFYDARGSELFRQIMDLPEYYLTRSEFEILQEEQEKITALFAENSFFHLIDLGAGDG